MLRRTVRGTAQDPGGHRGRLAARPPQAGKKKITAGHWKGPTSLLHPVEGAGTKPSPALRLAQASITTFGLLPPAQESEEAQGQQMVLREGAHRASQGGPSHPCGVPKAPAQDAGSWARSGPVSPDPPSGSRCLIVGSESPVPSSLMSGNSLQLQYLLLRGTCEMKQQWTQKLHRGQR